MGRIWRELSGIIKGSQAGKKESPSRHSVEYIGAGHLDRPDQKGQA